MSLTVTRARVKEKCGQTGTAYDSTIDNLIAEIVPVVEFAVREDCLLDTGNAGLQATLTLGATEIVCGEFAAQLLREPGAVERVQVGSMLVEPFAGKSVADPSELIAAGWARLRPYLKLDPLVPIASAIGAGGNKQEEIE